MDKDHQILFSSNGDSGLPGPLGAFDDFNPVEDRPIAASTAVVSLGFLRAALRRTIAFWCLLGLVGMVIGVGVYLKRPPPAKASTSVSASPVSLTLARAASAIQWLACT